MSLLLVCGAAPATAQSWPGEAGLSPFTSAAAGDIDFETARVYRGQAPTGPLVTDRPDFTEASSTVGQGIVQFETGYTYFYDDSDRDGSRTQSHLYDYLLRIGIINPVEFRLGWGYSWDQTHSAGQSDFADGARDLYLGFKLALFKQAGAFPQQAVILQSTVPTGAAVFSMQDVEFGVNYLYSWALPYDWSLGGSTGFDTATESGDDFNVWHQSVTISFPLGCGWGMYLEYFGLYSDNRASDFPENFINGGFTYLVNNNVQLDIRAGLGLNEQAVDMFTGAGASFRY